MDIKKLLTYALIAVGVFFLISNPTGASGLITHILHMLQNAAEALITFVRSLV